MEPISILLLAAVLTKMVTTYKEDREYARNGMEPPRHKLYHRLLDMAEKRQGSGSGKGSGRRTTAPARPGARGYFRDLWNDVWDDAGDYRRRLREEREANPRMTQAEQMRAIRDWGKRTLNRRQDGTPVDELPVDDMVDVAGVRPVSVPPVVDPWTYAKPAAEPEGLTPDPGELAGSSVEHDDQHPYCLEPCGPTCGLYGWVCGSCGTEKKHFVTRAEAEKAHRAHVCAPAQPTTNGTTPGEQPKLATVIPLFPNLKELLMSDTNSEVVGLDQAIGYSKALASFAGTHGSAGNEGYIGVLNRAKVAGSGLSTAHEMQEAFAMAQAAAERHAAELEKQKTVQEAYDQNPDAGDKEFQQQGR